MCPERDSDWLDRDFEKIRDPRNRHDALLCHLSHFYASKLNNDASGHTIMTDYDVLKQSYRFLRSEDDDSKEAPSIVRLARRYYDRLFKEYAICDLSRVSSHRKAIGLRWRTHKECAQGKGQFSCGAVGCDSREGLESYEVPFKYKEAGDRKAALVKVRVCEACATRLLSCGDSEGIQKARKKRKREPRTGKTAEPDATIDNSIDDGDDDDDDLFF